MIYYYCSSEQFLTPPAAKLLSLRLLPINHVVPLHRSPIPPYLQNSEQDLIVGRNFGIYQCKLYFTIRIYHSTLISSINKIDGFTFCQPVLQAEISICTKFLLYAKKNSDFQFETPNKKSLRKLKAEHPLYILSKKSFYDFDIE